MARRIKKICAYAFFSDVDLATLKQKLEAAGPWSWADRDSDYFGDYLSARARDDYAMLKVYENEAFNFQIDLQFEAEGDDPDAEWNAFHADILDRLLPSIDARRIQKTETMN